MKARHLLFALILCFIATGQCAAKCVTEPVINLTWQPNPEADIASYEIYRATAIDGVYSRLGETANTTYTDALPAEGAYWYMLTATDQCGNVSDMSEPSEEIVFDPNTPTKPVW